MSLGPIFPGLASVAARPFAGDLCRIVERKALELLPVPDFLYTSGSPGRYNPRGTQAIYGAEDQATAGAEADRYRSGRITQNITYWARVQGLVLDLADPSILAELGLSAADLHAGWRMAVAPTKCQVLGQEIANQARFAGIRFPSDATKERGFNGHNVVLFKNAVVAPASVIIRDETGRELQRWP